MRPARRVAIVGGGIAGVTAAWQLAQLDRAQGGLEATLFEASPRLGGTVETVYQDGFVVECGPDGWVTEKPWARELTRELLLEDKLIGSHDAERVTYILSGGQLLPMPDGMRLMVPTNLAALDDSPLFSPIARAAYAAEPTRADELRRTAPTADESIASFVKRHFGAEVLTKVAAPLLSGVFGGDVATLSVRAVMPAFVRMEQEHGSLILALQRQGFQSQARREAAHSIFTSLQGGTQVLVDRMASELRRDRVRLSTPVTALAREGERWTVSTADSVDSFDAVLLATPAHVTRGLLAPISARMAALHEFQATSALIVAFVFSQDFPLPRGFGFLVPAGETNRLLAATFVDQKYSDRVPENGRLLRAFFGGASAAALADEPDKAIAALALHELEAVLGSLPPPDFHVVRRWPLSLPQYGVGHLDRMAELERLRQAQPNLWLLGNTYRGVGLTDLIRDARAAARELVSR